MRNALSGAFLGALIGSGLGLFACVYLIEGTLLFPGDTILAGAMICGTLGWWFGAEFVEWLKENWFQFWN